MQPLSLGRTTLADCGFLLLVLLLVLPRVRFGHAVAGPCPLAGHVTGEVPNPPTGYFPGVCGTYCEEQIISFLESASAGAMGGPLSGEKGAAGGPPGGPGRRRLAATELLDATAPRREATTFLDPWRRQLPAAQDNRFTELADNLPCAAYISGPLREYISERVAGGPVLPVDTACRLQTSPGYDFEGPGKPPVGYYRCARGPTGGPPANTIVGPFVVESALESAPPATLASASGCLDDYYATTASAVAFQCWACPNGYSIAKQPWTGQATMCTQGGTVYKLLHDGDSCGEDGSAFQPIKQAAVCAAAYRSLCPTCTTPAAVRPVSTSDETWQDGCLTWLGSDDDDILDVVDDTDDTDDTDDILMLNTGSDSAGGRRRLEIPKPRSESPATLCAATAPACKYQHGTTMNNGTCVCGTALCEAHISGLYCTANRSTCASTPSAEFIPQDRVHLQQALFACVGDCGQLTALDGNEWSCAEGAFTKSSGENCQSSPYGRIEDWNVSRVRNLAGVLSGARGFNQDLSSWDISRATSIKNMLDGIESYPHALNSTAWKQQCCNQGGGGEPTLCGVTCQHDEPCSIPCGCAAGTTFKRKTTGNGCAFCPFGFFQPADYFSGDSCFPWSEPCGRGEAQTAPPSAATQRLCESCPHGRYQNETSYSGNTCQEWGTCRAGHRESVAPSTVADRECAPCADGRYQSLNAYAQSECTAWDVCAPGYKETVAPTPTRDRSCDVCPAGRYQDKAGYVLRNCSMCPPGTKLPDQSENDPALHDERSDCENCDVGFYSPYPGHAMSSCYPCAAATGTGARTCVGRCNPGEYENQTGCRHCPAGYFTAAADQQRCYMCPKGFYSPHPDEPRIACEFCTRGRFGNVRAALNHDAGCVACPRGRFSEIDGLAEGEGGGDGVNCKGCPPGRYSDAVGVRKESGCAYCTPGRYGQVSTGASSKDSCAACEPGMYSDAVGASGNTCQACPEGYAQNSSGAAYCLPW